MGLFFAFCAALRRDEILSIDKKRHQSEGDRARKELLVFPFRERERAGSGSTSVEFFSRFRFSSSRSFFPSETHAETNSSPSRSLEPASIVLRCCLSRLELRQRRERQRSRETPETRERSRSKEREKPSKKKKPQPHSPSKFQAFFEFTESRPAHSRQQTTPQTLPNGNHGKRNAKKGSKGGTI